MTDSREYPTRPICGVGVVVRKDNSVLLIQRGRAPRLGEWTLPGGAVELGESLRDAGRREVSEECGIDIDVGEVVDAIDVMINDDSGRLHYHYVVVDFAAMYVSGNLHPGDDVMDARWVASTELRQYKLSEKTRKVISKALSRQTT